MKELRETENMMRHIIHSKLRGTMTPQDNVLYFPNEIDVRLCPKNGITTLKWALWHVYNISMDDDPKFAATCGTKAHRLKEIKEKGFSEVLPFREKSNRITIVRDPIERFMSAAEYLKLQWVKESSFLESNKDLDLDQKGKLYMSLSELDELPDNLDDLITEVKEGGIINAHFFSQAHFLGARGQYKDIWAMTDFDSMMHWLEKATGTNKKLHQIHTNSTSGLYYGGVNKLTDTQKKRIMKIYEQDYDYGWVEENKTRAF